MKLMLINSTLTFSFFAVASACWGYCMKPDNKMDNDKMNLA